MHNRKQYLTVWCNVVDGRVKARYFNRSDAAAFAKTINELRQGMNPSKLCRVKKEQFVVG